MRRVLVKLALYERLTEVKEPKIVVFCICQLVNTGEKVLKILFNMEFIYFEFRSFLKQSFRVLSNM